MRPAFSALKITVAVAFVTALAASPAMAQDPAAVPSRVPATIPTAPPASVPTTPTVDLTGDGVVTTTNDQGETIIRPGSTPPTQTPPSLAGAGTVDIEFVDADIYSLLRYFAKMTGRSFILGDTRELSGKKVTIISNENVSVGAAWEAFMSALEVSGFTTVQVGRYTKVLKTAEASQAPMTPLQQDEPIPRTDRYVTQIFTLANVSASDISQVVSGLKTAEAKVIAYQPSNSLIITESGNNLVKLHKIITELDVAAPKSQLEIVQIVYAAASDVKKLIEELYGTEETASSRDARSRTSSSSRSSRRPRRDEDTESAEPTTAGVQSKYISKVMADDRTNSLIVIANAEGMKAVLDLISKIDVDTDLEHLSQIHVVRLEHAKAEDVANVLADLSQNGRTSSSGGRGGRDQSTQQSRSALSRLRDGGRPSTGASSAAGNNADGGGGGGGGEDGQAAGGAIAAFDSGMRIAADENTNALVIIASNDDFEVVKQVIDQLDTQRKQVFVDAVILELSSQDSFDFAAAYHGPMQLSNEANGFVGGQFGLSSLGLSQDLLTGLAVGVFGPLIDVPQIDGTSLPVPAFGIALRAMKGSSMVNIVSNPNLLTLDNQKAKIVVGRKIPFPTTSGLNNLGQPVVSFQREDVAITLEITPRINSENFVTLEVDVEVQEIEEEASAETSAAGGGFITSKRQIKTTALVLDNQTMVLGGLVGTTETEGESKVPVLGDIPIIGALFRSRSRTSRKTNLMVFLTPHIIDDEDDMYEIMRVKEAQREEFLRRFHGKSQAKQMDELRRLLQYSMNHVDQPSMYRGSTTLSSNLSLGGVIVSEDTRQVLQAELENNADDPGAGAGHMPRGDVLIIDDGGEDDALIIEDTEIDSLPEVDDSEVIIDDVEMDAE